MLVVLQSWRLMWYEEKKRDKSGEKGEDSYTLEAARALPTITYNHAQSLARNSQVGGCPIFLVARLLQKPWNKQRVIWAGRLSPIRGENFPSRYVIEIHSSLAPHCIALTPCHHGSAHIPFLEEIRL